MKISTLVFAVASLFFAAAPALADDPPIVDWNSPEIGTTQVTGQVPVQVNASDDIGIANVVIKDGTTPIQTFAPSPSGIYQFTWDTDLVADGAHSLTAEANDGVNPPVVTPAMAVTVKHSGLAIIKSDFFDGSRVGLRVSDAYGGAVYSLIWKNQQFISHDNNGSELQSTLYLNGLAFQCGVYEAGEVPTGIPSTVNYVIAGYDWAETDQKFAYGFPPLSDAAGCGNHDVYFHKRVTMNYAGMANVVEHDVAYTTTTTYRRSVPAGYTHGTFMVLSGNAPRAIFPHQYYYNLASQTLIAIPDATVSHISSLTACGDETACVPILTATGNLFAMAAWTPGDVYGTGATPFYNMWRGNPADGSEPLNEFHCRYNYWPAMPTGTYKFKCYTVVGTLDQVTASLDALYLMSGADKVDNGREPQPRLHNRKGQRR